MDNSQFILPLNLTRTNPNDINSLANAEMRLILTKLLWHFDLSLQPESENWSNQRSYSLWSRPALVVQIQRAKSI